MDVQNQAMLVRLGLSAATAQHLVNREGNTTPKAVGQLDNKMFAVLCENCHKLTPDGARARNDNGQDLQLGIFQQRALTLVSFFINHKFVTS